MILLQNAHISARLTGSTRHISEQESQICTKRDEVLKRLPNQRKCDSSNFFCKNKGNKAEKNIGNVPARNIITS